MDWLKPLNEALAYIEENLDGEVDPERAARIACCSAYHFQRVFSYMAGVPLWEYIRRRRMTCAAFDLQANGDKVLDVALRYGYDSPTAFNRAFKSVHGVTPSAARRENVALKTYPPISFKITIRGEAEMEYHVETRDAFRIVGVKMEANWTPENKESFAEIPQFWMEHAQKGTIPALCRLMDGPLTGVLGVCAGNWQMEGQFDYYIAVASQAPVPEGMCDYTVPAATWAVFPCRGPMPGAIQKLQERIITEWLPNSGYQYADAPDIEHYPEGDQSAEDYLCWVWLPVEKKAE